MVARGRRGSKGNRQNKKLQRQRAREKWSQGGWRVFFKKDVSATERAAIWTALGTVALVVVGMATIWTKIVGARADVQVIGIRFVPSPMVAGIPTKLAITIDNVGKNTAEIVKGSVNWRFFQTPTAKLPSNPDYSQGITKLPSNFTMHIVPNQIEEGLFFPTGMEGNLREFNPTNLDKLYSGRAHFWVYGYFSYKDRYSVPLIGRRTTGFCYTYQPLSGGFVDCGTDGRNYMYE